MLTLFAAINVDLLISKLDAWAKSWLLSDGLVIYWLASFQISTLSGLTRTPSPYQTIEHEKHQKNIQRFFDPEAEELSETNCHCYLEVIVQHCKSGEGSETEHTTGCLNL